MPIALGMAFRRLNRALPRTLRDERGFTLVEMLVGMAIGLLVGAACLALLDISTPLANTELERQNDVGAARSGLERMVRELRQADSINTTSPTLMDVNVTTSSGALRVLYECDVASSTPGLRSCVRYQGSVGGSVGSVGSTIVDGLVNGTSAAPVFTYTPDAVRPVYATAAIVLRARGIRSSGYTHDIALRGGFFIRNLDLSGG